MKRFQIGMKVWVGSLPKTMWHFENNCHAFIVGSYNDLCGSPYPEGKDSYKLLIVSDQGSYTSAWYPGDCLKFISDDAPEYVKAMRNTG